jgi:hypothetical protein
MSDYKEEEAKFKYNKQAPLEEEIPKKAPTSKKKDTKKWCKGKVGREHKGVCMTYDEAKGGRFTSANGFFGDFNARSRYLICIVCGKELSCYYPSKNDTKPKPDWVTK